MIVLVHPNAQPEHVGFIPEFLVESDPRPAKEQFHERYAFGGGWHPMEGFKKDARTHALKYPGDPALPLLAFIQFHSELIMIYPHGIVAIVQPDGTFEVARMD